MAYLSDDELLDTEGGFTGWDPGAEETLEQALAEERLAELESELEQDEHPIDYEAELEDEEEEAAPVSEKRLKRELRAEAIRRLEEAARTEKDFRAVVEEWNKLDRNRERRERDHENLRGDVPLEYQAVYLPKNHFIKEESMATDKYLSLFYPFDQLDLVKKGITSTWNVSGDRTMVALTMTFADEPMAKNMSFQREYAEPYDWVAQQFKDWAFTLSTSILYYKDYDSIDEDARGLYRKAMAAFGGIAPSYHIELLDKPTIYWDFHSLLLGIQMMFSFMLVDNDQPLRLCKHCQKVFLGSRSNAAFCSPRCKNQYNVYKSRSKKDGNEEE